jgi:hypothetical protein
MKKFLCFALMTNLLFILTLAVFAQKQMTKDEIFQQIAKLTNTKKTEDQAKAYALSKDFLAQYGKDNDDKVKKIRDYVGKYRLNEFNKALDDVRIADAIAFGKDILVDEPENSYVTMNLAYGGYDLFNKKQDKTFAADSIAYAKQTLAFFEAGKLPQTFSPFKDQAEASALMHYVIAIFSIDTNFKDAAKNFYKAVQFESPVKRSSYPFYVIAVYYEQFYNEQAANFQKTHGSKTAEDEALKKDREAINKTIDAMIDAYARAVKLAETDNNSNRSAWRSRLVEIYTYRKGNETGLNELINGILTTPMPEPN